ncbi:hypothetical protein V1639_08090 [Pseudarthrobacter sp. J75]|uniref:hypothetical protein n=1 Tax=unclassified Pseudarthrobacter TaxID=2647000 RepID=UPI002E8003F5|nr:MULTISPECIES: hypothetical protein [unclassified Pseudarthrobacter]MEE2522064.1 hypothetical protein [Pseudarthrobacter sp. J47]MEE2528989.1 hypothetical protein [Pseudarthrobacter sp. J75]
MTFETEAVTLKIWDRSTMNHTIDSLVSELSDRHNTSKGNIAVTCSGPNTYTFSLGGAAKSASLESVNS